MVAVNENQKIPVKEFLDSDENSLYDTISWEVPHLSEQVFEIIIKAVESKSSNESESLKAEAIL